MKYKELNKKLWDTLTDIHANSQFYDLEAFKKGKSTLKSVEREELGDVTNKTLLHLQCHFGLDSLSLARKGAIVTAIDYSDRSIQMAKKLSKELNVPAEFICSNIYDLPNNLQKKFDIVFTSYGVLHWLPDLEEWAKIVKQFLKPDGIFYIVEIHPILNMFNTTGTKRTFPYFHNKKPMAIKKGSCINPESNFISTYYEWAHSISDIINSLIKAGLILDYFHEFPFMVFNKLPYLKESKPGQYVIDSKDEFTLPLMYSIKAHNV